MSQRMQILSHLKKGKPITSLEGLRLFGSMQFPTRIFELREMGHQIETEMVHVGHRQKKVARYSLKRCKTCGALDPAMNDACQCGGDK